MTGFVRHFCVKQNATLKILKSSIFQETSRSYTSALYVPGKVASKTFALLMPDVDFSQRFSDIDKLQRELDLRGMKVDAKELKKTWDYFQYVVSNKHVMDQKKNKIAYQIQAFQRKKNLSAEDEKEMQVLITQGKIVKQESKAIKEAHWELEETVIPQLLKLPNEIDERTPIDSPVVLKTIGEKPIISEKQSHLDIGKNLNLIDYRNPIQCYLCNEAVSFELGILALSGKLLNDSGAIRVSCPDFSRSVIVEGCGLDHENPMETFILQNFDDVDKDFLINRLHLVGGASLPAMVTMFTKLIFRPKFLPYRFFTSARQYTPFPNTTANYGLFSACQSSAIQTLTLVKKNDSQKEFQHLVDLTSKIYDEIGCHYRVVLKSAKELAVSESMKVSFEMWSNYSDRYVEVGSVSACGEYFSKRLLIGYQTPYGHEYTSVISGTLVSVPRLLGCLLEQNSSEFVIPERLREFAL